MREITKISLPDALQKQINDKIAAGKIYTDLTPKQKKSLRNYLLKSQKYICCYCEKTIGANNTHIEHFFEQAQTEGQNKTLDYTNNLLASCAKIPPRKVQDETSEERIAQLSCGHKKAPQYHKIEDVNYTLLLNPMTGIAHLLSYIDGKIQASNICTESEVEKVAYTIERLSLNNQTLIDSRKTTIEQLSVQLSGLNNEEQKQTMATILDEEQETLNAYFSTLKDNFAYILDL